MFKIFFKKKGAFAALFVLLPCLLHAQDLIMKASGEEVQAKVLEISPSEVRYKRFDNINGPTYILPVSNIRMIRYENGTKDEFRAAAPAPPDSLAKVNINAPQDAPQGSVGEKTEDIETQGKREAIEHYVGKKSGSGWTFFITALTSPVIGLIPATACAGSEPLDQNLNYPNPELMKDYKYSSAYIKQAHKIKKRSVWSGYAIGSVMWLFLGLILLN